MAKRRVLVIDNDNAFLETVRDILAPYGFETQLVESDEDSVRMVRAIRPDAVFVAVENSDKSRLALCSKIKKAGGSQIPVILVTASLPKSEMELHNKHRYHADAYLKKHELSSEQLYEKIDSLIGLSTNDKHISSPGSDATDSDNEPFTSNGGLNTESVDVDKDALNFDNNHLGADQDDVPSWLREVFDKVIDDSSEDAHLDSAQTKFSIDNLLKDDWENYNELEHRLLEQEREINQLREQLEEALRQARSSPFSSDYLSLRQAASRKEKEIGRLKKQLNDSQHKLVVNEERLRELAKRLLSVQTEIDQKKSREAELSLGHEAAQAELAKLNTAFEESRKRYDSKIDEFKAEHRADLEKIEEKHKTTIDSLKKQIQEEKDKKQANLQAEIQKELKNIHNEYEARVAELRAQHADEIAQLTSNNYKEIQQFEVKLEQLQSDYQASLQKIKDEHQKEVDSLKKQIEKERSEALAKAELQKEIKKINREHDEFVSKLKQEHADEIAELKSAIVEAQNGVDTKIEAVIKDHEATLKRVEVEYRSEIGNLKDQLQTEKTEAISAAKTESQQELERLQREYDELKSSSKQGHAFEMAKHKSALDDAQKQFESEFNRLKNENLSAIKEIENQHRAEVERLKKQIQEEKAEPKKAEKTDPQDEIKKIQQEHKEVIGQLKEDHEEEITRLTLAVEELQKKLWDEGKLHKKDLEAFDKKYKDGLHELDVSYASEMAKIREKKDAEIKALKQAAAEDAQKAAEKLAEEKRAHEKTRLDFECQIADLLVRKSKK
ncbi:MAG: response regulator [Desulfobacterales bacterium]|nr:MAG: response regulator [Desulfobacterales bacterium]